VWQPAIDTTASTAASAIPHAHTDDITFGPGASGQGSWDQFAVNEKLFGVKTQFDEDLYTTKIDRSAADYKDKERRAQLVANEILGVRGFVLDVRI